MPLHLTTLYPVNSARRPCHVVLENRGRPPSADPDSQVPTILPLRRSSLLSSPGNGVGGLSLLEPDIPPWVHRERREGWRLWCCSVEV